MEITPLSTLKPYNSICRIRVRVSRIWRAIKYNANAFDGLHYILIDEHGTTIHAFMPEDRVEDMNVKPQQGQIYDIRQFYTKRHSYGLHVVENTLVIQFHGRTLFSRIPEPLHNIPDHSFRLVDFHNLAAERDLQRETKGLPSLALLTDVYGCIKSIRPPHPQYIRRQHRTETKCEITIENLRTNNIFNILQLRPFCFPFCSCYWRETLTIVSWGKLARDLDVQAIMELPPPVLAVFAGLKMGEYERHVIRNNYDHTCIVLNPTHSLTAAYKIEFSRPGDKIEIHGDFHIFETTTEKEVISVLDLTGKDPANHRGKTLFCKGQISIIGRDGWWYRCCPDQGCYKQCFKKEDISGHYTCAVHGIRVGIPCYRVNAIIQDEYNDVTVTIMGNQVEQLFGCKLDTLRGRRVYLTEQPLPPEMELTIGQIHIFEVNGNTNGNGWNVVGITSPPDQPIITLDTAGTSSTTAPELSLKTPERISVERKRGSDTGDKETFKPSEDKKAKRNIKLD